MMVSVAALIVSVLALATAVLSADWEWPWAGRGPVRNPVRESTHIRYQFDCDERTFAVLCFKLGGHRRHGVTWTYRRERPYVVDAYTMLSSKDTTDLLESVAIEADAPKPTIVEPGPESSV